MVPTCQAKDKLSNVALFSFYVFYRETIWLSTILLTKSKGRDKSRAKDEKDRLASIVFASSSANCLQTMIQVYNHGESSATAR